MFNLQQGERLSSAEEGTERTAVSDKATGQQVSGLVVVSGVVPP